MHLKVKLLNKNRILLNGVQHYKGLIVGVQMTYLSQIIKKKNTAVEDFRLKLEHGIWIQKVLQIYMRHLI